MNVYQKLLKARVMFLERDVKKSGINRHLEFKYFELQDIVPPITEIGNSLGLLFLVTFSKPTVNGLAMVLGINRRTLYQWSVGECRSATHTPVIKKAMAILQTLWEDYMLNGKVNPVSGIFLGKNHFGYQDKTEVVITPKNALGDEPNPEEVRKRYLEEHAGDDI